MVRVTTSEDNGALAATTCTQRDNTRTYTTHHTHAYPNAAHRLTLAYTHTHARVYRYSFVSLAIRMTMVMRPSPEGFSAHNAIPLVTDNGRRNCSLPVASPFFSFFFSPRQSVHPVIFTLASSARFLLPLDNVAGSQWDNQANQARTGNNVLISDFSTARRKKRGRLLLGVRVCDKRDGDSVWE